MTVATFTIVTYNLFLSTTNMHNNRAYLLVVLAVLAVAPCGRELSADAWLRARRGRPALPTDAPGWPLLLLRFEACVVYGASGVSKLVDPDWIGGRVTWDRMVHQRNYLQTKTPTPDWLISLLTDRTFHTFAAKVIVLTELFIAVGLAVRATRYAAVWVAVCFHVAIELSAIVEVFSYIAIAALVIWAVPSTRDRVLEFDPADADARRFVRFVARSTGWHVPRRIRPTGVADPDRRPRRHDDGRRPRAGVRAEPPSCHRLVRVAAALAPFGTGSAAGARAQRCVSTFSQELTSTPGFGSTSRLGDRRRLRSPPRSASSACPDRRRRRRTRGPSPW